MMKHLSLYWFTKVATYILAGIMALVVLLLLLLSTETGSRFTVNQASHWAQNWVQFESFEGTLLRDFKLNKVSISIPDTAFIDVEHIHFRWRPWQLLQRQIHIRVFDASGVTVTLPESDDDPAPLEWPITLPNIDFNMRVRFDHVLVENTSIHVAEHTYSVNRLQTRGRYENNQLRIHDLQLQAPEGRVQLRAELSPQDSYELNVKGDIHAVLADIGNVSTHIQLTGSLLDNLTIAIEATDNLGAIIEGNVEQLLSGTPTWQLDAALYELNHPSIKEHLSNFTIQFNGHGDLKQANGHLLVTGVAHEYGLITVQADGIFAEDIAELSHFTIHASEFGLNANISGQASITPSSLTVAMEGDAQWRDLPNVILALSYKGDFSHVDDLLVELKTELGVVHASGSAAWDKAPEWDLMLHTEAWQLERLPLPDSISQYIQGSLLNSALHVQGTWGEDKHYLQVEISELDTQLDGQTLNLTGSATLDQNRLQLDSLKLSFGEGFLHASGTGEVDSFTLKITSEQLSFDDFTLAALNAELWLDPSFNQLPLGNLSFKDFAQTNGFAPTSVDINLTKDTSYRAQLKGSGAEIDAAIVVVGEWNKGAWQGALEQLEFSYPDFGHWMLNKPTEFSFDNNAAHVEPFCLSVDTHEAKLCAGGEWAATEQRVLADLSMSGISLGLLEPWLPNTITAQGILDVEAHYDQRGAERSYTGHVYLHETRLNLPDQDVNLVLRAGNIVELQGNEQRLDGRISISTDAVDGGLVGVLALDSPFKEPIITAEVDLDFASLKIVSLLIPEIQNVKGELAGNFQLNGPLAKPSISGELVLCCAGAEVPAAGLVLDDLNMTIKSPEEIGGPFTISGRVHSGEGSVQLEGRYDLASHVTQMEITGENFMAMNSREIQLVVSPQAQVEVGPNVLKVRGNITVPRALITPPDFNTVDLASNDTIILRGEETLWQSSSQSTADIDIQMSLGDDFNVNAYGFEGRLAGRVRVIEKPSQDTTAVGNINVASGRYELYGQALNIDRGTLVFTGGIISNPGLDLRVSREFDMEKVTVGARVGGSLQQPNLNLFSTPTMQDAEILSYLVFGRGFGDEAGEDQNMLLQASLALGMQGGNLIGERLSASLGVDDIMLDAGDTIESASLYIGKHLSSRLYIKYGIGLVEPVNTFFIRYRLTDFLNFETQTGTLGSGADLFYSIER